MAKELKKILSEGQKVTESPEKETKNINEVFEEKPPEEPTFEERKYNNYSQNMKPKSNHFVVVLFIIISSLTILVALFSTVFALVNVSNTKIISGVHIKGIDVGGLTKEEATQKLQGDLSAQLEKDITLNCEDYETSINPAQIEFNYQIEDAVKEAYQIGREGNIFENNYQILATFMQKKNLPIAYQYNQENQKNLIADIEPNLPHALKQYSYYVEDGKLIITKGTEGYVIQQNELANRIIESIQKETQEEKKVEIPVEIKQPESIDLDKIHQEIYVEPQDAYYTTNPFTVYPHVEGVDFDVEKAKEMLQEDKEEYTIPLKYTKPNVTTSQIGTEAFPDLLSSFSTKYDASNKNRSNNLKLAINKINGVVLMPGEEFSYNKVVGERSIAAGYKEAKVYSNGQVVDGLGGGICQISSTLYNAVVYANLDVTSRRNHQFVTSYVKAGLDATVVYGSTDFKFKNTRSYPIKIVGSVGGGVAKIDIYGIREETEYEVRLEPVVINTIPFTTKTITDSSLPAGKKVVEQKGANGVKTVTYKYLILNGRTVSNTV